MAATAGDDAASRERADTLQLDGDDAGDDAGRAGRADTLKLDEAEAVAETQRPPTVPAPAPAPAAPALPRALQQASAASFGATAAACAAKAKEFAAASNHANAAAAAQHGMTLGPTHDEAMTLLFMAGTAYGNLGQHTEAEKVGAQLVKDFADSSRGYYILGIAALAQNQHSDAIRQLRLAKERVPGGAASPAAQAIEQKIQEAGLKLKQRKFVSQMAEHNEVFQCYRPLACPDCKATFTVPTPQWYCSKCFPGKGVLIWEPDTGAKCGCCDKALGRGSRHHCRCCGHLACADCSKNAMPVPALGFHESVRVCYKCHKMSVQRAQERRAAVEAGVTSTDNLYR